MDAYQTIEGTATARIEEKKSEFIVRQVRSGRAFVKVSSSKNSVPSDGFRK